MKTATLIFCLIGNCSANFLLNKKHSVQDAHLAEMNLIASQYRSGAKSRKRLFIFYIIQKVHMNINFLNATGLENSSKEVDVSRMEFSNNITFKTSSKVKMEGAYAVNLDSSLMSDNVYSENGKTAEDIQALAENTDVQMQQNYKTLLSNTMTAEDYAAAEQNGFDINNMDPAETVTIVDKIKTVMLEAGQQIAGYNDDISSDKLAKITGSTALASKLQESFSQNDIPVTPENVEAVMETVRRAQDIAEISEGTIKYMVLNKQDPSVENLYVASHSTNGQNANSRGFYMLEGSGYLAQKADNANLEHISDQINSVIKEAGFDVSSSSIQQDAKWMITQNIPLTVNNLTRLEELKEISVPINANNVIGASAAAIADGKPAEFGNILEENSNLKKARDIYTELNNITDSDIERVLDEEKELTIKNLGSARDRAVIESQVNNSSLNSSIASNNSTELIVARKQLEEARYYMTIEANYKLLKTGFSIDTAPMEDLINKLQSVLDKTAANLFGMDDTENTISYVNKYNLYEESISKVKALYSAPISIIGRLGTGETAETLDDIYHKAANLQTRYDKAGITYEKLMTSPRADLGDNIQKAFRNTDEILEDIGEELNEQNRRAIRILGYNRMTLSPENIDRVRTIDAKLTEVVRKLNPGSVLEMIREGKNPLQMTLDELGQEMDQGKNQSNESSEKFAKFLYKMEQNNEISAEEKETFIGIYRLFNNLNKTNNSAIGAVLETGADMTISNLLTAMRTSSKSKKGMDYTVDDDFGGLETTYANSSQSISVQIDRAFNYYSQKASVVYRNLEPEKLHEVSASYDSHLDELADSLEEISADRESDLQYYSNLARNNREILGRKMTYDMMNELDENGEKVTINNLDAMNKIRNDRRKLSNHFSDKALELANRAVRAKEQSMIDEMGEVDDFQLAYEQHLEEASSALTEIIEESVTSYVDIKAITLMQKQLSVRSAMAQNNSYEIPVEVDGIEVNMHVMLKKEEGEGTKLEVAVRTEEYGSLTAVVTEEGGKIKGILSTSRKQDEYVEDYLGSVRDKMKDKISNISDKYEMDNDSIMIMYNLSDPGQLITGSENGISDSRDLLGIAKAFVKSL